MAYRVTDSWTTRDGHWYNSGMKYDIDLEHIVRYDGGKEIPQAGAATHIILKAPPGSTVQIKNRYDGSIVKTFDPANSAQNNGWVDYPMGKESVYFPQRGETGPWNILVNGQTVKEGVGLPESFHVSDFNVIAEENGNSGPTPEPEPDPGLPKVIESITIQLHYSDGTTDTFTL